MRAWEAREQEEGQGQKQDTLAFSMWPLFWRATARFVRCLLVVFLFGCLLVGVCCVTCMRLLMFVWDAVARGWVLLRFFSCTRSEEEDLFQTSLCSWLSLRQC